MREVDAGLPPTAEPIRDSDIAGCWKSFLKVGDFLPLMPNDH